MKGKLSYWGRKSQENTKTRKTLVGIHYLGPKIEKHKNTQNTNNTFGHSRPYNEPYLYPFPHSKWGKVKKMNTCKRDGGGKSNRVKTSAWTSCNPLRVFFAVPIAFGPPEQYFFMIFVDTRWQNISLWFCPWLFPLWFYPRRAIMETLYLHVNYMCLIYKWQIPFVAMKLLFVSCI